MPASAARAAAFEILLRVEKQNAFAIELLHSHYLRDLSPADRGLCTEIVLGVLRWRSRLDAAIADQAGRPLQKLDLEVLTALRIAAYQVGFLERVPQRAAVNESVELVKRARKRSAVPFANAVLRKLTPAAIKPSIPASFASPAQIAETYAHPPWLVERWATEFGLERAAGISACDQAQPLTAVRLRNPKIEEALRSEGVQLAPGALLASARRVISGDVTKTRAYAEGAVFIQDEGSQLVAALVGYGSRVLDCCAAPGGKTAAIAERNPTATVLAAELHPHRARLMRRLFRTENVQVVTADALALPFSGLFDRVLADVPCSGTGTLARNPEIKWRLKADDLADLHARQVAILRAGMAQVAPGGRVVYSTCSLEREENQTVVEEAVSNEFRIIDCRQELQRLRADGELVWEGIDSLVSGPFLRTLPGTHPCDGFFAAVIERM